MQMYTPTPDFYNDYIAHHGILGQKWGVRRYQNPDGSLTAAGKKRYSRVIKTKNKGLSVIESKRSPGIYKVYDKNGKKVGDVIVDDYGKTDHIDWLGVKESERRKGYGKDILDSIIEDSKRKNKSYVTLDAAGLDPAAMHIYESRGFKSVKQLDDGGIWDGLTVMQLDLRTKRGGAK